jgi:hypothetical protein
MGVGNAIGVKVSKASVGKVVPVGGGVSVGRGAGGGGEEQEMRRRIQKAEIKRRIAGCWSMDRILIEVDDSGTFAFMPLFHLDAKFE